MEFLKTNGRRQFLTFGLSAAALFAMAKFWKRTPEKKTKKFLTRDGKLVELDTSVLPASARMVTKPELENWVTKKRSGI